MEPIDPLSFIALKSNLSNFINYQLTGRYGELVDKYEVNATVLAIHRIIRCWDPQERKQLRKMAKEMVFEKDERMFEGLMQDLCKRDVEEGRILSIFYMISYLARFHYRAGNRSKIRKMTSDTVEVMSISSHCDQQIGVLNFLLAGVSCFHLKTNIKANLNLFALS